jgi:predicted nucleotidyltransferase
MTAPLLDISEKIDQSLVELCAIVADCAAGLQIPYLVVGASARDMVLHYGYGAKVQRAAYLLTTYENIPAISDQLYREETLMERYDWDITLAGAHQLGINIKPITLPQTYSHISELLNGQRQKLPLERLINEMGEHGARQYALNEALINAFKAGFLNLSIQQQNPIICC